jgi:hypothetical protein
MSEPESENDRSVILFAHAWLATQHSRARRDGPFTVKTELTPALAKLLLDSNPENRKISPWLVRQMVRDIKNGRWALNGETLIVALSEELNDGQHRCQAVIDADKSIRTMITFGVERESRFTIDTGQKKSIGDHLDMWSRERAAQIP